MNPEPDPRTDSPGELRRRLFSANAIPPRVPPDRPPGADLDEDSVDLGGPAWSGQPMIGDDMHDDDSAPSLPSLRVPASSSPPPPIPPTPAPPADEVGRSQQDVWSSLGELVRPGSPAPLSGPLGLPVSPPPAPASGIMPVVPPSPQPPSGLDLGAPPPSSLRLGSPVAGVANREAPTVNLAGEIARLEEENNDLRRMLAELRPLLEELSANDPDVWIQKEQDYQNQIADRDQQLAERDQLIQQLEQHLETGGTSGEPPPPTHTFTSKEVEEMFSEVERERVQLERDRKSLLEDRRGLREDEEALMNQMREMELSMARERADMARQRTELQRLHAEIRHELEIMQRGDASMKERLAQFQRRHSEALMPRGPGQGPPPPAAPGQAPPPAAGQTPVPGQAPRSARDSGLMRRFFGGK